MRTVQKYALGSGVVFFLQAALTQGSDVSMK